MSPILCISDFELQSKHLEKFKSNRATKIRRRKSKVFCMYGTVALRSPTQLFKTGELQFYSYCNVCMPAITSYITITTFYSASICVVCMLRCTHYSKYYLSAVLLACRSVVWGKKLSGVEWSGVKSWSGVCIVQNRQFSKQNYLMSRVNAMNLL